MFLLAVLLALNINSQSVDGANLWAFGMMSWYDNIQVYDQQISHYLGKLSRSRTLFNGEPVWSTTTLLAKEIGCLDFPVSLSEDKYSIVFVAQSK
ncbi:MAG: hypothetical protein ACI8WB_002532 [Phenylobacterium sp.]